MSPVELSPVSQATSSTLWAQPSRKWVVPAKPRPGRKPKGLDDSKGPVDEESSTSRRVQNRAAQRAFRERKQTQLAELQARLHSYEQGEIEHNIALQNIARKMKEENEELRQENQMLREKIARMEQEHLEFLDKHKKRAYDNTSMSSPSLDSVDIAKKRVRVGEGEQEAPALPLSIPPSSSPLMSLSDVASTSVAFPPGGRQVYSHFLTPPPISDLFSLATNETTSGLGGQDSVDPYTCILCNPDTPCVCREVVVEQTNDSLHQLALRRQGLDQPSIIPLDQSPTATLSILENSPTFQAPVPIRRRTGSSSINPVFPVTPMATLFSASKCSGDPNNCVACADDNFGKAFCQAIGHTVNSTTSCVDCPERPNQTDKMLVGSCCGDVNNCGSCGIAPIVSPTVPQRGSESISTDDAWRQLKSHPNVAFADLTLLAEVVARRSKCTGSRVVISPVPESVTPDHDTRLSRHERTTASEDQSVLPNQQKELASPPQLVPQHVLVECGRRRVREVNTDGVREALRLLDQKFAHTR